MNTIATKEVRRRTLNLDTIEKCIEELDRIKVAATDGTLESLGNWTPGQIMAHLAAWIEYGWEGYPMKKKPFVVRWILKIAMKLFLKKGMPAGTKIPGVAGGTTGQDNIELAQGIDRLKRALERMKSEPAVHDSPAFGKMSEALREKLNLRHAELHLGFLKYPDQ